MKILVLSNFYPPHVIGGYEITCRDIVDELLKLNYDVKVLTSRYGGAPHRKERKICRLWRIQWPQKKRPAHLLGKTTHLLSSVMIHQNVRIFKRITKEFKPDAIFVFSLSGLSIQLIRALQTTPIPKLFYFGDLWLLTAKSEAENLRHFYAPQIKDSLFKRMQRKTVLFCLSLHKRINWDEIRKNKFIFVSRDLKKKYEHNGLKCQSSVVIPPGINIESRAAFQKKVIRSEVRLLYVGRLEKAKGVHILIEGMRHLISEIPAYNIKLNIVGAPRKAVDLEGLKKVVRKFDLEDHIFFVGPVAQEEVDKYYKEAHCLIFPSIGEEAFGQTQIEAMKYGLPVISSGSGGAKEIVEDGINGFLYEPDKPQLLAQAIYKIIEDKELYAKLSFNAYNTVSRKFNRATITEKIVNIVKLIDGSK